MGGGGLTFWKTKSYPVNRSVHITKIVKNPKKRFLRCEWQHQGMMGIHTWRAFKSEGTFNVPFSSTNKTTFFLSLCPPVSSTFPLAAWGFSLSLAQQLPLTGLAFWGVHCMGLSSFVTLLSVYLFWISFYLLCFFCLFLFSGYLWFRVSSWSRCRLTL